MPDKPKRRKPNKHQRNRNKNKQELNKNSNVESVLASESCSTVVDENKQEKSEYEEIKPQVSTPVTGEVTKKDVKNMIDKETNQDLNSNSTELLDLNTVDCTKHNVNKSTASIPNDLQYVVESPEQSIKSKPKLNSDIKSKSLDNEDATKIVDITEEYNNQSDDESTLHLIDSSSVLVSDVESDIEWEKADDLQEDSIPLRDLTKPLTTCDIPITLTQSDQHRTLTPEEEESLRNCLQKIPLTNSTNDSSEIIIQTVQVVNHGVKHRLRKKASADEFIFHRLGPPRTLDVIDEEGSSESSKSSRRQSYLSEKKNDHEDLDDEVFVDTKKMDKYVTKMNQNKFGRQIQQQCMLLDTKLKEPEVSEARGDWSVTNVEKMIGAEVVYLTDTSSSTSSIYDNSEDGDEGVDTDVSVRMITPTIEVTDTETFLKETFVPSQDTQMPETPRIIEIPIEITRENDDQANPSTHEIVVLSTDEIKTNLTVKDVEVDITFNTACNTNDTDLQTQKPGNEYDLEMKVLKCELNDAINNLIKEVSSDSESSEKNDKGILNRQDSSSSVGSSQCTAKYNPTYSSLNDVANIMHDDVNENLVNIQNTTESSYTSHVNDVFECVTGISSQSKKCTINEPRSLKDLCVQKVATFPYGDKILEELASVSKRLQNITIYGQNSSSHESNTVGPQKVPQAQPKENMPYYPLPDVSSIEKVTLPSKNDDHNPPPVQPRNSSLKLSQDENHWVGMQTENDPVYVCLSPSQKMLMEKTNTVITKEDASQLVDMHKKYVDRRGYNEYYDKERRKENQRPDNPPVVPFKSQTGSRLLALIRDPSFTDNINSMKSKNQLKILDQIGSIEKKSQAMSFKRNEHYSSAKEFSSSLKPVPPPRTRKFSSSIYESDESSDFTDSSFRSIKSEKKSFHYSTGNLSKEIENDISSIQNMHRYYTDIRDQFKDQSAPRRPSLPKDLCDQQMEYIRLKEKEVEAEIRRLENEKLSFPVQQKQGPRAPLTSESRVVNEQITRTSSHSMLLKKDSEFKLSALKSPKVPEKPDKGKLSVFSSSQEELLREKIYSEYVNQMAEREERRQQKVIKITNNNKPVATENPFSKSMPALDFLDSKVNNRIEKEFIWKARERWNKLGIKDPETEDEKDENNKNIYKEPKVIEHKIKVIEGGEEKDVKKLPSHLQEFVRFTVKDTDQGKSSPGESSAGPASPHVMILCAVIILVLAVGKIFWRMLRNK